jgi:hypothetical protein
MCQCSAGDFTARDAELYLMKRFPYEWRVSFSPPLGIYRNMPHGVAFEPGEFPVEEVTPGQPILKHFPGSKFFVTKVRTNELHLNDMPWPILVGVVGDYRIEPRVFVSLGMYGQGEFFDLFKGGILHSEEERVDFGEALGKLVLWYLDPPCTWLPTGLAPAEVRVRCTSGKLEHDLRVFFHDFGLQGEMLSGAVVQERLAAQPALAADRP